MISFDIETEPLAEDVLRQMLPEFDQDSVAVGNLKDPAKIAEKIAAARESHESKFFERAALSAETARVLIVSYHSDAGTAIQARDDSGAGPSEEKLLTDFWTTASKARAKQRSLVGVFIHGFDLPFLCRRSWLLGLDVPTWVRNGRYWDKTFVDLCDLWRCGQQFGDVSASFETLARAFGTPGKPDGCTGKLFYQAWRENREAAINYAKSDVVQPAIWARQMGVLN